MYETGLLLLLLFAHVALLLLPLSLFPEVRAPSLSLVGFMFMLKLLDVARHCLLLHQLQLLCFSRAAGLALRNEKTCLPGFQLRKLKNPEHISFGAARHGTWYFYRSCSSVRCNATVPGHTRARKREPELQI